MAGLMGLLAGLGFGRLSKPNINDVAQCGHKSEGNAEQLKTPATLESNYNTCGQSRGNRPISKRISQDRKAYSIGRISDSVMRRMFEGTIIRRNAFQLLRPRVLFEWDNISGLALGLLVFIHTTSTVLAVPNEIPAQVEFTLYYSGIGRPIQYFSSAQEACSNEVFLRNKYAWPPGHTWSGAMGSDIWPMNKQYTSFICEWDLYAPPPYDTTYHEKPCAGFGLPCSWRTICPKGYITSAINRTCFLNNPNTYPKQPPKTGDNCPLGNPIYPGYGNKQQPDTDYTSLGSSPLEFKRTYNSNLAIDSQFLANSSLGALGVNWLHSYSRSVKLATNGTLSVLYVYRPDGQLLFFTNPTGTTWIPDADIADKVAELKTNNVLTGYQYTVGTSGEVETYDTNGKLLSIKDRNGLSQNLAYSVGNTDPSIAPFPGLLIAVTDDFGHSLKFTYNNEGRIATLETPKGEITSYSYSAAPYYNLKVVTYPDDNPDDGIIPTRTYLYGTDPGESVNTGGFNNQPTSLTGILDESSNRYATFTYDTTGRAISTEHAGGVEKYSLGFNTADPNNPVTTITDPLGSVRSTHFTRILDVLRPTGTDQPGGSGCSAASSAIAYDANGNALSRTGFNGHKACYAYDLTRNLETKRVEGLASVADCQAVLADGAALPANARKISTAWHPDWRLPVKVAEPKKLTTYVYNGQVDPSNGSVASCAPASALVDGKPIAVLCKKAEQATSDATGAAGLGPAVGGPVRAWTYSYNAAGQVLAANGPRGDVLDRTTYTYYADTQFDDTTGLGHTQGDVWTVKNALDQATTFNSYDKNGRPTQITEANGVATTLDYFPRGWLKALTVAAPDNSNVETTQYSYDPTGLPKAVTQPDGNVLTYGYDDAHRLRTVTDSLGNKVVYTLDNMGNRLKETYWDPGSAAQPDESVSAVGLRRKISRSYDALDRLQTLTTGAGQ